ncbi:MAG TPA: alpha/beta hydrolase [Armatimonadota bacterium]|nr:alpha/beta hydrolase [Armatimonadota bacterium]
MNTASILNRFFSGAAAGREPSSDLGWDALRASYAYDAGAPLTVTEELGYDPEYRLSRLRFRSGDGSGHTGLFLRPAAEGVYPCVLLLHALSSDKDAMVRLFGRALAERGLASLALDAHLHGERGGGPSEPLGPLEYVRLARESILEYRHALDYLGTRADVDAERTGLLGYSLGAMMGCILAGVDERVRASLFMVAGDMVRTHLERIPPFLRRMADPISPVNFVPHISPRPVFFINGKWDATVPTAAATLLHEAARDPKQVVWVEAGHILPPEAAAQGVDWLEKELRQAEPR